MSEPNYATVYIAEGKAHLAREAAYQSVIQRLGRGEIHPWEAVRVLREAYRRAYRRSGGGK